MEKESYTKTSTGPWPTTITRIIYFLPLKPMIPGRDGQEDDFDQPYTGKKCTRRALLIDVQLEEWVL